MDITAVPADNLHPWEQDGDRIALALCLYLMIKLLRGQGGVCIGNPLLEASCGKEGGELALQEQLEGDVRESQGLLVEHSAAC